MRARTSTRITNGLSHSCAVNDAAQVYCWGQNYYGQLGVDPALVPKSNVPVLVPGLAQVVQISAGYNHTCALSADGQISCWGSNNRGQLGFNNPSTGVFFTPSTIVGFSAANARFVQVAAGGEHTCAVRDLTGIIGSGNSLYCWGRGTEGQLGDGLSTDHPAPTDILFRFAIDLAAGATHTCAVSAGGWFTCWGSNGEGELGDGTTTPQTSVPINANPFGPVADISAGDRFTCATLLDGHVACWGRGSEGQLGTSSWTSSLVPVMNSANGAVSISAGRAHACVNHADGRVSCWGLNYDGQIGNGTVTNQKDPVNVYFGDEVFAVEVSAGAADTCISLLSGAVKCWGANRFGEVGDGNYAFPVLSPTAVVSLKGVNRQTTLASGYRHACAIRGDGFAECWGNNSFQQTGAPTTTGIWVTTAQPVQIKARLRDVDAGSYHSCGITDRGKVICWGRNLEGQLGNGASGTGASTAPSTVTTISQITGIATGKTFTCAVSVDGTVYCWGDNSRGQLGNGSISPLPTPTPVAAMVPGRARKVVARGDGACALVDSAPASVYCWGHGFMGDGVTGMTSDSPTPVAVQFDPLSKVGAGLINSTMDIAHGDGFACVIEADGTTWCWGINFNGQLGLGSTTPSAYATPLSTTTGDTDNMRAIAAGATHTCGLRADGSLWCWGDNAFEELGVGTGPNQLSPVLVPAASLPGGVRQITAGDGFTCAAMADQSIRCWGNNYHYQCGNTGPVVAPLPVPVMNFP